MLQQMHHVAIIVSGYQRGIPCEDVRWDSYAQRKFTFFHGPDGLPLELHE